MNVSIIGSNGLLSTSIGLYCNKNEYNLNIYGLTPPKCIEYNRFYHVDLVKDHLNLQEIIKSDIIIYAAGAGIQSNLHDANALIYKLNVFVPIEICNELSLLEYKGAFVTFGSYFEIGENADDKLFTEFDILSVTNKIPNAYCISKRMLTRFASSYDSTFIYWHFILPTIYGENENSLRLIPYIINALKNNEYGDLKFTSGCQIRQYLYIQEVANIIHLAYNKMLPTGIYNIEGNEILSVKDIVEMIFNFYNVRTEESMFGKTERSDINMNILKIDGCKLYEKIMYRPKIKIKDVYNRY